MEKTQTNKKNSWMHGLRVKDFEDHAKENTEHLETMLDLSKRLNERLEDEKKLDEEDKKVAHVGKVDPRKRLARQVDESLKSNIVQMLGSMVDTMVF